MRKAGKAKRAAAALSVLAVGGAVALPTGGASASAGKPKPKTITLNDPGFYSPSQLTVKKGGKVIWKWSNSNSQPHNVTLKSAPKGVKKSRFRSNDATSHFTFKTTFEKVGKYHFVCTIHPTTMQADIKVKN